MSLPIFESLNKSVCRDIRAGLKESLGFELTDADIMEILKIYGMPNPALFMMTGALGK